MCIALNRSVNVVREEVLVNYYSMTDNRIATEIGERFRQLRLRINYTQEELSKRALISVTALKSLESGKAKISTMIAVLRELNALDDLDNFLPDPGISPLQLAKMKGKKRKRATGKRLQPKIDKNTGANEW